MKDGFYTKDSMFTELLEVADYLEKSDLKTSKNLPAMIILERQLDGMNKHAICGRAYEVVTLFEWGIDQYARQNNVKFEDVIKLINEKHKGTNHIVFQSEEYGKEIGE